MKCASENCVRHLGLGLYKLSLEGRFQYFCSKGCAEKQRDTVRSRTKNLLRWIFQLPDP